MEDGGEAVVEAVALSASDVCVAVRSATGLWGGALSTGGVRSATGFEVRKLLRDRCPFAKDGCEFVEALDVLAFFNGFADDVPDKRRFSGEASGPGAGGVASLASRPTVETAAFVLNMSFMFRRLSNSGRSLPDRASMSFVGSNSLCLAPSMNMPGGFIMSKMLTGLDTAPPACSSLSTQSLVDAYTGQ